MEANEQSSRDDAFLRIARERRLLTDTQIEECRQEKERTGRGAPEIALENGLLSQKVYYAVLRMLLPRGTPRQIDKYEVIEALGEGAMGSVYKVRHSLLDEIFALKVLSSELARSEKYVQRFHREGRIAARIEHPHVVRVTDLGQDRSRHFLCMEFVDGETVEDLIEREGALPEGRALKIVGEIAEALAAAEEHKIIHRDIKPGNIMVTRRGQAKLTDLGLARQVESDEVRLTVQGAAMGTPAYMAPEQTRGAHEVDKRADFYALGATLFHMVTGRYPYVGTSVSEVIIKVMTEPVPDPRSVNAALHDEIAELIMKMIAKDPADRPQNAAELQRDIRAAYVAVQGGETFARTDPSMATMAELPSFLLEKKSARKRYVIAAMAVLLIVGIGAGVLFLLKGTSRPETPRPGPAPVLDQAALEQEFLKTSAIAGGLMDSGLWEDALKQLRLAREVAGQITPRPDLAPVDLKIQECESQVAARNQRLAEFNEFYAKAEAEEKGAEWEWNVLKQKERWESAIGLYIQAKGLADAPALLDAKVEALRAKIQENQKQIEIELKLAAFEQLMVTGDEALQKRDWPGAIRAFQQAKEDGRDIGHVAYKRLDAKIEQAQKSLHARQEYARLVREADDLATRDDLESLQEARRRLDRAVGLTDDPAEAKRKGGAIGERIQELVAQDEAKKKALALLEEFRKSYFLGIDLMRQSKWDEAHAALTTAHDVGAGMAERPAMFADVDNKLKEIAAARQSAREREVLLVQYKAAWEQAVAQKDKKEWEKALAHLDFAKGLVDRLAPPPDDLHDLRALETEVRDAQKRDQMQHKRLKEYEDAYARAVEHKKAGAWERALDAFQTAARIGLDPDLPARPSTHESIAGLIRETRQAQDHDAAATARKAKYRELMDAGQRARRLNQLEEAVRHYEQAKEHTSLPAEADRAIAGVRAAIARRLALERKKKYDDVMRRGGQALAAGDLEGALRLYHEGRTFTDDEAEVDKAVAQVRQKQSDIQMRQAAEARAAGQRAAAAGDPAAATAHFATALRHCEEARKLAPDPTAADQAIAAVRNDLFGLRRRPYDDQVANARALQKAGRHDEAIRAWEQATRLGQALADRLEGYDRIPARIAECVAGRERRKYDEAWRRALAAAARGAQDLAFDERKAAYEEAVRHYRTAEALGRALKQTPENMATISARIEVCRKGIARVLYLQEVARFDQAFQAARTIQQQKRWDEAIARWQALQRTGAAIQPPPENLTRIPRQIALCRLGLYQEKRLVAEALHKGRKWKEALEAWRVAKDACADLDPKPAGYALLAGRIAECREFLPPAWAQMDQAQIDAAEKAEVRPAIEARLPGNVPLRLVFVPAGKFVMGAPDEEQDTDMDEGPEHDIEMEHGFYVGMCEVTQAQWKAVMGGSAGGANPSRFKGDSLPVDSVTWRDGQDFVEKLNALGLKKAAPGKFRMLTEAEWEYCTRAGTTKRFSFGDDPKYAELPAYAWFDANAGGQTRPVAQKQPNPWGLYDVHGNVAEWVQSEYARYPYRPDDGREDLMAVTPMVLRGGSFESTARETRAAFRDKADPMARDPSHGLRVMLTLK